MSNPLDEHSGRCFLGFWSGVVIAALFSVLTGARMWFGPGCNEGLLFSWRPFPFIAHGGVFTETFVICRGVRARADKVMRVPFIATMILVTACSPSPPTPPLSPAEQAVVAARQPQPVIPAEIADGDFSSPLSPADAEQILSATGAVRAENRRSCLTAMRP